MNRRFVRACFGLALTAATALLAAACQNTTIDVADYDTSCKAASDCTDILVGDACSCGCNYGAIAKSALPQFEEDRNGISCDSGLTCVACEEEVKLDCVSGKCAVTVVKAPSAERRAH